MVFIWLLLLADVHLIVHAQNTFSLYGLKLEYNQEKGLPDEKEYKNIYSAGAEVSVILHGYITFWFFFR